MGGLKRIPEIPLAPHPSRLTTTAHEATSTTTAFVTVVDTTGNGYCSLLFIVDGVGDTTPALNLTIDGVLVISGSRITQPNGSSSLFISFKTSIKVEIQRWSGTGAARCRAIVAK